MILSFVAIFSLALTSSSCNLLYFDTQTNFSPIVVCLKQAIDTFAANSSVIFFFDEIQSLSWTDTLLGVMRIPKFVIGKQYDVTLCGFYVLFPELTASYRQHFSGKIHSRSTFLLVWQYEVDEEAIELVFQNFWYHRFINVVAMVGNESSSFNFYTFDPYSTNKCGVVGTPYTITAWTWQSRRFSRNDAWFPRKLRDLAGCPLTAIGNHQPPDNIMHFNGTWSVEGVGGQILRVAERYVNFSSIIVGAQLNLSLDHVWYYFDREIADISQAIEEERADFAFGWYSFANMKSENFHLNFELGRVSSIDCFGWAVPYRAGNKPPNITYYVNEFKLLMWCLVLVVFVVCASLFYTMSRRQFVLSTLVVWQTFLEQPVSSTRAHEHNVSFRVLFSSFCFYSLVISAAYKASFSSFLSVPNQGREFRSVKDILNSSLHVRGSPLMQKIVNDSAGLTTWGKAVLERFEIQEPCDYAQIMTRLVRQRDIAVISVKRMMYFYSIREAKRIRVKIPFRFIPGCLVRPHTTHFMFKRGSHLVEPFNVVLNRLFESGIITYWILHLGTNRVLPLERLKGRKLKVSFLKEPLLILLAGYLLASSVLLCEILVHTRSKRKSSNRLCPLKLN